MHYIGITWMDGAPSEGERPDEDERNQEPKIVGWQKDVAPWEEGLHHCEDEGLREVEPPLEKQDEGLQEEEFHYYEDEPTREEELLSIYCETQDEQPSEEAHHLSDSQRGEQRLEEEHLPFEDSEDEEQQGVGATFHLLARLSLRWEPFLRDSEP